jgi:DNA-binding NarL/FixJ family response regulator
VLEIDRASPLSIFDRQLILRTTSTGKAAGTLPEGHHDDSAATRFSRWVEPGEEGGAIVVHPEDTLTPEEEAVAHLLIDRQTFREIARALGITKATVERRYKAIRDKLGRRAARRARELEG